MRSGYGRATHYRESLFTHVSYLLYSNFLVQFVYYKVADALNGEVNGKQK